MTGRPIGDFERTAVSKMIADLGHRGPDSHGVEQMPSACIGAARLAILGLEDASNQPLRSPDSPRVIVFNGEIYNYKELRTELLRLGHHIVSTGDTEVLLHAFEEWGPGCLSRLNGMFAFAIYSEADSTLFFARDRFGVKPLYYTYQGARFAFASEPKVLVDAGLATAIPDEHAIIDYLEFGVTDTNDHTFFDQIRQLRPGQCGTVIGGKLDVRQWYVPHAGLNASGDAGKAPASWSTFRGIFESSVALRKRSDVPLGLLLSGGLDSSAIAAIATSGDRSEVLQAYSVSFPNSRLDESAYATLVAQRCAMSLRIERAETMTQTAILACLQRQQEPFLSPSVVAQWLVMETVHNAGGKVLLSGQGADEYLAGYEYFDAFAVLGWLRAGALRALLRHVFNDRNLARAPKILAESVLLAVLGGARLRPWTKSWLAVSHRDLGLCDYYRELLACRNLHDSLRFHLSRRLQELLRYEDRNSMAFSVETRHPFLDFRLVELVLSLPDWQIVGDGYRKQVLRQALSDVIPHEVLARRDKIGFQTPRSWTRSTQFRENLLDLLGRTPKPLARVLRVEKVKKMVRHPLTRRREKELWRIYCLLLWYGIIVENHIGQEKHSPADLLR